jgi:hypothetical protein
MRVKAEAPEIPPRCPQCGAEAVRPIVYGYPAPEATRQEDQGEIILGGCVIFEEAPTWRCKRCDAEGGRLGR